MDYLLALLGDLGRNETQVRMILTNVITIAFFGTGIAATMLLASASSPLRRRLKLIERKRDKPSASDQIAKSVAPISHYILPTNDNERSAVREHLVHAGYRSENALAVFYAIKFILVLGLPAMVIVLSPLFPKVETGNIILAAVFASFLGAVGPNYFLRHKRKKRQRLLRNSFPDALDLLVVCVEAGLALSAAIQRVAEELSTSHPELAEELVMVTTEVRAGIDNVSALKNLAERTGLEDIRGLVTLLAQSMRFGTSIAGTLRVYSEEFRDKRAQAAEEQAAKIATKMLFPLVLCLWPGFFLVAVGPAVLKIIAAMGTL